MRSAAALFNTHLRLTFAESSESESGFFTVTGFAFGFEA
jgi:hypothetical protein